MIESLENKAVFTVGSSNQFAFNIPFYDPESIKCYLGDPEHGSEIELVQGVDFTVEQKSDYSHGANITLLVSPLPSGQNLAIVRELELVQQLNLPNNGKLPSEALETQLDKFIMICQQLTAELSRAVKVGVTSGDVSAEALLSSIRTAAASALEAAASASDKAQTAQSSASAAAKSSSSASSSASSASSAASRAENAANQILSIEGFLPLTGGTLTGTVNRKFPAITLNVAPTSASYTNFATFRDKNDKNIGVIQLSQYAQSSDVLLRIYTMKGDGSEGEKIVLAPGYVDLPATVRLSSGIIKSRAATERLAIYGGTTTKDGAYFGLRGNANTAGTAGEFFLAAVGSDGNAKFLTGKPDGALTWLAKDITLGYPNYAAGVNFTSSYASGYTAPNDGWMYVRINHKGHGVFINGSEVSRGQDDYSEMCCFVPVKKGDRMTIRTLSNNSVVTSTTDIKIFYPNR
jgi:hypothetical protein